MAVVSISRIQVRRGRANEGTGLPQLASGEFGWALDTQELYIGNGSTAEGAPAVGNTQILTENTNIFELGNQYTYRQDSNIETSEAGTVSRSVSERLDDRVSVRSFGGVSQTQQLQKAFYELFLLGNNIDSTVTPIQRAEAPVLYIEPGVYVITETIYVPPFTTIVGAGKDKTVLRKVGDFDMFRTVSSETFYAGTLANSSEVFEPNNEDPESVANQARNIRFEDMTLEAGDFTAAGRSYLLRLENCRDSNFRNIRFAYGLTDLTDSNALISGREVAIGLVSKGDVVCTRNNKFVDCDFIGLREAAYGPYTVKDNTFVRCKFNFLQRGVALGENLPVGQQQGARGNLITDSSFDNISEHAFLAPVGVGNKSENNTYGDDIGNNIGGPPAYPIVSYGERGNFSIDDTFERTYNLSIVERETKYYPEVEGPLVYSNNETLQTDVSSGESPAFRLPADTTKFYTVDYLYENNLGSFKRVGTLSIVVNVKSNIQDSNVELVDEYEFTGDDGAAGASISFKSAIQFDDSGSPTEIWGAQISTVSSGAGFEGGGVGGTLVFTITSKS